MSPGAGEIFGMPAEDMIQNVRLALALLHPDDVDRIRESILQSAVELSPWHQSSGFGIRYGTGSGSKDGQCRNATLMGLWSGLVLLPM